MRLSTRVRWWPAMRFILPPRAGFTGSPPSLNPSANRQNNGWADTATHTTIGRSRNRLVQPQAPAPKHLIPEGVMTKDLSSVVEHLQRVVTGKLLQLVQPLATLQMNPHLATLLV